MLITIIIFSESRHKRCIYAIAKILIYSDMAKTDATKLMNYSDRF